MKHIKEQWDKYGWLMVIGVITSLFAYGYMTDNKRTDEERQASKDEYDQFQADAYGVSLEEYRREMGEN